MEGNGRKFPPFRDAIILDTMDELKLNLKEAIEGYLLTAQEVTYSCV